MSCKVVRSSNDIRRDEATGRLTYGDGAGGVSLITQEFTHRGFSRNLGEPEMEIRVRTLLLTVTLALTLIPTLTMT